MITAHSAEYSGLPEGTQTGGLLPTVACSPGVLRLYRRLNKPHFPCSHPPVLETGRLTSFYLPCCPCCVCRVSVVESLVLYPAFTQVGIGGA